MLESDVAGGYAVDGAIAADPYPGSVARHLEYAERSVVFLSQARAHQQRIGRWRMHNHALVAGQQVAAGVRRGLGFERQRVEAGRWLVVRQHRDRFAGGQRRQQSCALLCAAERGDGLGRQHCAGQVRLQHQAFAQCIHHQHRIERAAAESAVGFRHLQRQQAQVGEALPGGAAEAFGRWPERLAPRVEADVAGDEATRGFQQHLLFFAEGEIHIGSWCCSVGVKCWRAVLIS